jgi:nucleotide-binding universal stress UspA family protein
MYEKILVPLDGSKESERVVDHVRVIAKSCGVPEVVLLRVIEPLATAANLTYIGEDSARDLKQKAKAAAEEYLSYAADRLRTHCGGVKTAVLEGNPASVILDYASENGVDLIAMSTHGASGLTRWAIGSVTERVIRHSAVPLLVLPAEHRR